MKRPGKDFRSWKRLTGIVLSVVLILLSSTSLVAQSGRTAVAEPGAGSLEEIYIQTDRDIYIAGEAVYFRTMQFGRLSRNPGTISKVVYVDLLDSYKTPVVQVRVGTDGITGAGVFMIPDTLRTGNYFIRSFTNLMKNYPQALFAYKKISVINPFESLSRLRIPPYSHQSDSVHFYPETGSLVSGVQTRMGIRCYNSTGDPVIVKGSVINGDGDTLTAFSTDRYGTGLFALTPRDTRPLYMVVAGGEGAVRKFDLPPVRESGLAFTVGKEDRGPNSDWILSISTVMTPGFSPPGGVVRVVYSHVSGKSIEKEMYPESNHIVTFSSESLPAGLARISIYDNRGEELCSRWYYNETRPGITCDIKVSPASLSPRDKAVISIGVTDAENKGNGAGLAISVIKPVLAGDNYFNDLARLVQLPSLQSFSTDLVLPDINDYLIFCDENGELLSPVDGETGMRYLPEPEGHLISGFIKDRNTGTPLAGENLSLSFVGRTARCVFTRTGPEGEFSFPVREYGKKEIVIQQLSSDVNGYYVDLTDPFLFEMKLKHEPGPFYPDTARLEELNNAIIGMQVMSIYAPFLQKKSVTLYKDVFPDFFGEPDRTILLSEFIELTTLKEVFKEIVPGLSTTGRNERSSLRLVNMNPGVSFNSPPLVIIDGVPLNDLEKVLAIRSSEIDRIELLNTRYFIGDVILDGIVNIVSRKGDLSILDFDRSLFRQEYDMLLDSYEVTAPDYSTDILKESRIPDLRNTLYWNPAVRTDSEGNAEIEFWTSDEAGEYLVIVEGFTSDGRSGRSVTSFTVGK